MQKGVIQTIIIAGVLSMLGILGLQIFWVRTSQQIQKQEEQRQRAQRQLVDDEFNDRVRLALSNSAQEILNIYNDPAESYKAVEQLSSNYFVVRINDTLHPYLLERILLREFDRYSINEPFQYGIYDCFTDSIVFSGFVAADTALQSVSDENQPFIKWENDGHYFGVRFTERENLSLSETSVMIPNAWPVALTAVFLALGFFTFAVFTIIRQKKLGDLRNDFISNMTHELKTPISTIQLSAEMLGKESVQKEPDKIQRYADIILKENKRLEQQVERVLQISKLERGKISLTKSSFSLHELIEDCVSNFGLTVKGINGQVVAELNAESDEIYADKVHVHQILTNLIDNAIKYSPTNPTVTITTENVQLKVKGIRVQIKDNGIGIVPEQQQRIFEKFYRAQSGNVHNVKGFGLGLYYVKLLIEDHGGHIDVKSKLNEGSTFTIWLPLSHG